MTALVVALIVVVAYFLGSIPFGLIISRRYGIDIRTKGSGNIGATNVWRVLGKKAGITTFLLDVAKGSLSVFAGVWIGQNFAPGLAKAPSDVAAYSGIAAALGCIIGHSFPIWLGFKGGKGVATSLGVIIGMMPAISLVVFAIWGIVFKVSRYVSLASIVAAISLPAITLVALFLNWLQGWAYFYFALAAALLVVRRHRDNIKRLMAGTENRFGAPKPPASDEESKEDSAV